MVGCDSLKVDRCWFTDCGSCVVFKNKMALTNRFTDINVGDSRKRVHDLCLVANLLPMALTSAVPRNFLKVMSRRRRQHRRHDQRDSQQKGRVQRTGIGQNNSFMARDVQLDQQVGSRMGLVRIAKHLPHCMTVVIDAVSLLTTTTPKMGGIK